MARAVIGGAARVAMPGDCGRCRKSHSLRVALLRFESRYCAGDSDDSHADSASMLSSSRRSPMPVITKSVVESSILPSRYSASLRSEEHTSELPSLMRISYAVFCLKKKTQED